MGIWSTFDGTGSVHMNASATFTLVNVIYELVTILCVDLHTSKWAC
jgi:hypothetical protein